MRGRGAIAHAAWAVLACACAPSAPAPVHVAASDAHIRRVGRFDLQEPEAPRFAWPATELALQFRGPAVRVDLSDVSRPDETPETDWLAVELDGKPAHALALRAGRHLYTLAENLEPGAHVLRLRKRTEAEVGTVTLHGFELPLGGVLLPPPPRPSRRIEVIGDSISAGYGNEGADANCHFSAPTEDATRSYAALAARRLDAELSVAAWSGKGLLTNYESREHETMFDLFERVLPTEPAQRAAPDHSDVVIVNLGTNDFFRAIPDQMALLARFRTLLARIRERSGQARVLLVLTPMLADDYPQPHARSLLRAALQQLVAEAPGERAFLEQWVDPAEGLGCDFHPNLRTHERLGRELADALTKLLGWTPA